MRGGTVQINWHDTKPVLTLDFHPTSGVLATGGADFDIKLWFVNLGDEQKKGPTASYQNSLAYHGSAVNVIRFSPHGQFLASGADGGELVIWKLHSTDATPVWKVLKTLSFHRKDVLDLQWSSNGGFIVSGSVDNSCIIWDVNKGSVHQILDAHLHYVQGVAWDPLDNYIASLSSDRTCRIYVNKLKKLKGHEKMNYVCQHVISKLEPHTSDESKSVKSHLFHDETLPSFFRRLAWSPDGSFLLVPAGTCRFSPASEPSNTTYIFSRKDLTRPALLLPGASKAVVAVRFCPLTFTLRGSNSGTHFNLPYRVVFAVATLNSLYVYDTESIQPIAIMAGLHYAAITDIAWSPSGKYLALSSQDGYCTLVEFENDELGLPVPTTVGKKDAGVERGNPVGEPENMVIEISTDNGVDKADTVKAEVAINGRMPESSTISPMPNRIEDAGENRESSAKKPEVMATEIIANNGDDEANIIKAGATIDTRKETSVSSTSNSLQNKPTKRRITPMAID